MKVTSKTLMVNLENDIKLANGMISLTVEHQAWLYESKNGEVSMDLEFIDYNNIEFMGMPVKDVKIFKTHLSGLGFQFDEILNEACVGVISNRDILELKGMFKK